MVEGIDEIEGSMGGEWTLQIAGGRGSFVQGAAIAAKNAKQNAPKNAPMNENDSAPPPQTRSPHRPAPTVSFNPFIN